MDKYISRLFLHTLYYGKNRKMMVPKISRDQS